MLLPGLLGQSADDETVQRRAGNLNPKPDLESDRGYEERHARILIVARSSLHVKAEYICADYSHSKENPCQASGGPYIWVIAEAKSLRRSVVIVHVGAAGVVSR